MPRAYKINMEHFTDKIIKLFQTIHPLDRVPRAGYLLRGVPDPESVSAHSHFVALLAVFFVEEYPGRFDSERVLKMALLHDLPEALLMDIPMPHADAYLSDAKHHAEEAIFQDILSEFPEKLRGVHWEFCEAQTQEARLLRGLDKAQMMLKVLSYEKEHRGYLEEFWQNPKNFCDYGILEVAALFDSICLKAGRAKPLPDTI